MELQFEKQRFGKRLGTMLKVDFRRLFTMPLIYIMLAIALVMPILVVVMVTMMEGSVSVDPQTGVETGLEGFDSAWQMIAAPSGAPMSMDITSMCNINLMYFAVGVFICLFVSQDFSSGYAKNLFTVRAKKGDYVISKTLVGIVSGVLMLGLFLIGSILGGAIAGLPFDAGKAGIGGVAMCMAAKCALMAVFAPIFLAVAVAAKQKAWLSICCSMGGGMLLFMMIPMLTPLDATLIHVLGCLIGGTVFSLGLGAVSRLILKKTSLV